MAVETNPVAFESFELAQLPGLVFQLVVFVIGDDVVEA